MTRVSEMTDEDLLAVITDANNAPGPRGNAVRAMLEKVAAAEREACKEACRSQMLPDWEERDGGELMTHGEWDAHGDGVSDCINAIRSLGPKETK